MRFGPDFSRFGHKDISCCVRNRMLDKIIFRQSHVVFCTFFIQHVYLTLFHLCPAGFSKVLLALILGGTSKSHVFEKRCIHLV